MRGYFLQLTVRIYFHSILHSKLRKKLYRVRYGRKLRLFKVINYLVTVTARDWAAYAGAG